MRHIQLLLILLITFAAASVSKLVENPKRLESTGGSRFAGRKTVSSTLHGDESEERGRFSFVNKIKPRFKAPAGVKKPEILKTNPKLVKELNKNVETLKKNPKLLKTIEKSPSFAKFKTAMANENPNKFPQKETWGNYRVDTLLKYFILGLGGTAIAFAAVFWLVSKLT